MPMSYPEATNVDVLVNVQRRCSDNLPPETVLWLAEVIQAGLVGRENVGRTKIQVDKQNGVISIISSR